MLTNKDEANEFSYHLNIYKEYLKNKTTHFRVKFLMTKEIQNLLRSIQTIYIFFYYTYIFIDLNMYFFMYFIVTFIQSSFCYERFCLRFLFTCL